MEEIKIQRTEHPAPKPDPNTLGFGHIFSDHMFLLNYDKGKGWHDPRIVPYGDVYKRQDPDRPKDFARRKRRDPHVRQRKI